MPDLDISGLPLESSPIGTDLLVMVDDPAGVPVTKKTTIQDVLNLLTTPGDMILGGIQTVSGAKTFQDGKFLLFNIGDTQTGQFSHNNTAARTYGLLDSDGDIALKTGTPVNKQIPIFSGNGIMFGGPALTFDIATDTLAIGASGKLAFGAIEVMSDASGLTTLKNIDAIDAATEATLEGSLELDDLQGNLSVSHLNSGTGASKNKFWAGDGTWRARSAIKFSAGTYEIGSTNDEELYGGLIYSTIGGDYTLPDLSTVSPGARFRVMSTFASLVEIDPNINDSIILDGVLLADGNRISSLAASGDWAEFYYYDSVSWFVTTNGWTDGGP